MKLCHVLAALASAFSFAAGAQTAASPAALQTASVSSVAQASAASSDGEVRKIDKEQGKVTLRHGPITNLEMPGMTMVFKVADPKMLDAIKQGDKVKFVADKVNGAITVTAIETIK